MIKDSEHFYSNLPVNKVSIVKLLEAEDMFTPLPENWHVIITDITNSTGAVHKGMHQTVNLAATGSIVVVLNIAYDLNISIPFFFGGDGATFLVPGFLIDHMMDALAQYKANIFKNFNLKLRTETISVAKIYEAGHQIKISKFKSEGSFSIPIVLGSGLAYAEHMIKAKDFSVEENENNTEKLNLEGMLCRWDIIEPPKNKQEVVTLLVIANGTTQQAIVFKKVLQKIDELYGLQKNRQPISIGRLKVKSSFKRLGMESRMKSGSTKWLTLIFTWFNTQYFRFYFTTKKGKQYLKSLVIMSDTLVIDGKINTIISGTEDQRSALQQLLDEMESNDEIIYGMHISNASIMSCYVRNIQDDHVHFVDGSDGGYSKAATMLKEKQKYRS
ncbi:DUF3095 domain-containing protein [Flavobacterium aquidurense]|uniref:DUF3095 domain-containing protein n=1 Tax=Flavobacterium aquidurense TaxID=362413 RepID=UPI00285460A6|nr:DUF3095 domain-containing protein [Flavobacterium aquidurense]MDR7371097.1 hypothetical protein [Flavobacterium aquidurense]